MKMGTDLVVAHPIFHSERAAYVNAVVLNPHRESSPHLPETKAWLNASLKHPQPPLDFDAAEFARDSAGIIRFERLEL